MNADGRLRFLRSSSKEQELPTGVARDGLDRSNEDPLAEVVLLPVETLVGGVEDVIRRVFVAEKEGQKERERKSARVELEENHSATKKVCYLLGNNEDGSIISELPEVSVFVNLLPGESSVSSQEGVRIAVSFEGGGSEACQRLVDAEVWTNKSKEG